MNLIPEERDEDEVLRSVF